MDGGAWKAVVHGVAEGWTRLSDFTFTFHFHALEKEMRGLKNGTQLSDSRSLFTFHFHALEKEIATHSSVLAWMYWQSFLFSLLFHSKIGAHKGFKRKLALQ